MPALIDLVGQSFGRLKVLNRDAKHEKRDVHYLCQCECGALKTISSRNLRKGYTKSCGCLNSEMTVARNRFSRIHGSTGTPEYCSWISMKKRCQNKNHHQYENYGGRGIKVCDRWTESYVAFIEDMGLRPTKGHTLDRIDVDGPYSPENCRWATAKEQSANRRKRGRLDQFSMAELCGEIGLRLTGKKWVDTESSTHSDSA